LASEREPRVRLYPGPPGQRVHPPLAAGSVGGRYDFVRWALGLCRSRRSPWPPTPLSVH